MPRSLISVALAGTLALAAGCQNSRSGQASTASAPPPSPSAQGSTSAFPVAYEDWATLGYRLDWVGFPFPKVQGQAKVLHVEPYSDIVVAQESASTLTALEASTGQVRWTTDLTGPLTKWTGIVREAPGQGRLLVASESEMFLVASDTGNLVGRERFERVVNTPPLLAGPMAIFGTTTGVVQAHLVGRHVSAWNFGTRGGFDTPLLAVGGYVAGVAQSGDVVFLTTNGDLVGRGRILGGLDAAGVTDGNNLYLAGRDQSVWAFDTAGRNLWRYRTSNPLSRRPSIVNATLYVDLGNEALTAFDAASGAVKWHAKDVHGEVIALRNGRLLVWDGKGVSVVEPSTGDRTARVELPGVARLVPDAIEDGHMYAVSSKGVFAKFTPR